MDFLFFVRSLLDKYKSTALKVLLTAVGVFLICIFSGVGYVNFEMSSRTKIILYIFTVIYFAVIFIFSLKIAPIKNAIRLKRIPIFSPFTICILAMSFMVLLSFIFNKDKALNINTYISFIITLVLCWFILRSINSLKIIKLFKNIMLVISILALVLFLASYFSKTFIYTYYYSSDVSIFGTNLFLENGGITGLTNTYHFDIRASSIFWEPSVFGSFLIAALICDLLTRDKLTLFRGIVFFIAIISSKSTAAIIMLFPYLLLVLSEFLNGSKRYVILSILSIAGIVLAIFYRQIFDYLAKYMPSIFDKITKNTASFTTRILSYGNYFKVWLKSPIFGFGGVTANDVYYEIAGKAVTSETSTFGLSIASFGLVGFIYPIAIFAGIIFCDEIKRSTTKLILIAAIFLLSNVQGQGSIIGLNILYFMPLSFVLLPQKAIEYNKKFYDCDDNTTIKDIVVPRKNNTGISNNIFYSFVLKGVALIISFFTIPVYLKYFNNSDSNYGLWAMITSILTIITVFDFGMGNGLKNKLIRCLKDNDEHSAKIYVSTTYSLTAFFGLLVIIILSVVIFALPDDLLLITFFSDQPAESVDIMSFRIGVFIILFAIGVQFCLKNINYILQAHQRNAITGIFSLVTNTLMLLFCLIFANSFKEENKIFILAVAYFILLNVPLLIANIILFSKKYKSISPSFSSIDFRKSKEVISTSFKFFAIQIGVLFIWSLDYFFVHFLFGRQSSLVSEYTKYYHLVSLLPIMLGTIVQQPFWTALSKADTEKDFKKIKTLKLCLIIITISVIVINLILVFALQFVFNIWLGSSAPIVSPMKQYAFLAYSIIYVVSLCFIIICNAFSLFKTQLVMAIMGVFVKLPLLICLLYVWHVDIGWEIIIFVNLICYLPVFFFAPLEIHKYMKKEKQSASLTESEGTK